MSEKKIITVLAQSQTCLAVRYKCEKGLRAVYCRRGQGRPGCRGQTNAPSSQELCCNPLFSQPFFSSFAFVFSFCLSLFFLPILGFPLLRVILSAYIPRSSCNCICMNMIFFHFLKNSGKNCIFKKVTPFKLQNFQNRLWQNLIAGNYY